MKGGLGLNIQLRPCAYSLLQPNLDPRKRLRKTTIVSERGFPYLRGHVGLKLRGLLLVLIVALGLEAQSFRLCSLAGRLLGFREILNGGLYREYYQNGFKLGIEMIPNIHCGVLVV